MKVYFDFSTLLAIATLVAGLIWLLDVLCFKKKRLAANASAPEPKVVEYAHSFFPVLLIVFLLRAFVAEPFRIPSGSMKPTLLIGDFILVNKYDYGLRLPITGTKIVKIGEPKRGDIIVFRFPKDTSMNFIKRVIGLPGDKIRYQDKVIYLNGKPLAQEFLATETDLDSNGPNSVKKYDEKLIDRPHDIYLRSNIDQEMPEITVPEGMYFVMGDNRDRSEDSRAWGFVPDELILGKAVFIWMSWDPVAKDIRFNRIGTIIKR